MLWAPDRLPNKDPKKMTIKRASWPENSIKWSTAVTEFANQGTKNVSIWIMSLQAQSIFKICLLLILSFANYNYRTKILSKIFLSKFKFWTIQILSLGCIFRSTQKIRRKKASKSWLNLKILVLVSETISLQIMANKFTLNLSAKIWFCTRNLSNICTSVLFAQKSRPVTVISMWGVKTLHRSIIKNIKNNKVINLWIKFKKKSKINKLCRI